MSRRSINIISVFGQIEGVVADAMTEQSRVVERIKFEDIPVGVRYNDAGIGAHCALVLTPDQEREFDARVRELRM